MKSTNQDGRDTMSDEHNIDKQEIEPGRVDVEGHVTKIRFEPEQDVEGQGFKMGKNDSEAPETTDVSDAEAADESEVEGQIRVYRYEPAAEVEGQRFVGYSDETIKQAIQQVENALAALAKLDAKREPAEVEGQYRAYSDETLKQAVEQVKSALEALKAVQAEVEGQGYRFH